MEVLGMEILFELQPGEVPPQTWRERATQTGNRYRVEVPEADLVHGAG